MSPGRRCLKWSFGQGLRNMDNSAATPTELRERARRYREMVRMVADQRVIDALISIAEEYETVADQIEKATGRA